MNQGWTYRDQVNRAAAGSRLLDYYAERYRHSARQEWQARIEAGQILVDGQPAPADTVLRLGQQLSYQRPPWQEPEVPLTFDLCYEDADVVVVAKPAGLPVLPGGGFLQHTLLWQLQQRYPKNPPLPVHRLGRGTSGLLLLARSPLARAHLSRQLRQSSDLAAGAEKLEKTYRALVGPCSLPPIFTLSTPIGKVPHPQLGYVYGANPSGRPALSTGRVLRRAADTALLEVAIATGRPHQIRIHLAAAGCPLLGDPLYAPGGLPRLGSNNAEDEDLAVPGDGGYWLHAYRLRFIHPQQQRPIQLVCPPPPALAL